VKFSRVSACLTKSGNPQRWPAFWSFSLRVSLIIVSLILLVGATAQLVAQSITSGDIVGLVTDPSGAVLANASVTLKNQENGSTQAQSTNSRGAYRRRFRCPRTSPEREAKHVLRARPIRLRLACLPLISVPLLTASAISAATSSPVQPTSILTCR
jgi:carboxypeptidase family protein